MESSSSSVDLESMDDLRIEGYDPLLPPNLLAHEVPLSKASRQTVRLARLESSRILTRCSNNSPSDDRVVVIVGPCSIHHVDAALEYGRRLSLIKDRMKDDILILMRSYFEKPRTTVGWKGLINDPFLDGSFRINDGLRLGRRLLCDLTDMGMPVACELLDTISPQYLADLISWGAIGARTTESQLHRVLASGVSFPVGFKNGTDGNISIAIDAIRAASHPHRFLGVTHQGLAAITKTTGNNSCHVILRGGQNGPNYSREDIAHVRQCLVDAGLVPSIMVDCSHGNSQKKYQNQHLVLNDLCEQIAQGDESITGIMIESNLVAGNQKMNSNGLEGLVYGQSITDACVGWDETVEMLEKLQQAVQMRRSKKVSSV